jgi:hypothetical protein
VTNVLVLKLRLGTPLGNSVAEFSKRVFETSGTSGQLGNEGKWHNSIEF